MSNNINKWDNFTSIHNLYFMMEKYLITNTNIQDNKQNFIL